MNYIWYSICVYFVHLALQRPQYDNIIAGRFTFVYSFKILNKQ